MLAAANAHGLDAIGVELSRRRAARARRANHEPQPMMAAVSQHSPHR
jgi:hypothetical protein